MRKKRLFIVKKTFIIFFVHQVILVYNLRICTVQLKTITITITHTYIGVYEFKLWTV